MTIKRKKNSGQFTTERLIGNKFALGNKPNKTSFKKGVSTLEKHPSWKGGVQFTKRDGYCVAVGVRKRIPRGRYVWESVYGELPKGYVMWHKDGDKYNDDIENLEAITRAELLDRNRR